MRFNAFPHCSRISQIHCGEDRHEDVERVQVLSAQDQPERYATVLHNQRLWNLAVHIPILPNLQLDTGNVLNN